MDSRLTLDLIVLGAQQGNVVWAVEIASAKVACKCRCIAQTSAAHFEPEKLGMLVRIALSTALKTSTLDFT